MKWVTRARKEFLPTLVMLVGVFAFRSSIAEAYRVPTGSMIPTIQPGDFLVVSKLSYGLKIPFTDHTLLRLGAPRRGDIVVFEYPLDPSVNFVKRLIGLPGDLVEVADGYIRINGTPLTISPLDRQKLLSLAQGSPPSAIYYEKIGSRSHLVQRLPHSISPTQQFRVPEGSYFFMGDNRDNSNDSRFWGFVPGKSLKGKALGVYLSLDSSHGIVPGIRWERIGERL